MSYLAGTFATASEVAIGEKSSVKASAAAVSEGYYATDPGPMCQWLGLPGMGKKWFSINF